MLRIKEKKKCEKCERLCFPGRVHRPWAEALWKGVAARIRFTLSDSKSRNDFLVLRFGQTTTDTQWWGVGGRLEPCSSVNMYSSRALISPFCRGKNEATLFVYPGYEMKGKGQRRWMGWKPLRDHNITVFDLQSQANVGRSPLCPLKKKKKKNACGAYLHSFSKNTDVKIPGQRRGAVWRTAAAFMKHFMDR